MKGKATLLLILAVTVVISWGSQTVAEVLNPTVIGPIQENDEPGDPDRDYIFFTPIENLSAYGYIEEEFFIQGNADNWLTVGSELISYTTRIVVRRPMSNKRFNGTVLLEWQNVTGGYDKDVHWSYSWEHIVRSGYAWVGVSVQGESYGQGPVGVDYLKAWSDRYEELDVTADGTLIGCELCMDIFSQAAQAIRSPIDVNPMGGLKVREVVAVGASQSQWNLVWYHNFTHPDHQVVDAFLLFLGVGAYSGELLFNSDSYAEVFKVNTETDIAFLGEGTVRQPDSGLLHTWEVAGASHNDWDSRLYREPIWSREGIPFIPPEDYPCYLPVYSRVPVRYVLNSALDRLVQWMREGTLPPAAPPIEGDDYSTIQRDVYGNALGGIRLPHFDVPTATNTGVNGGPEGSYCYLNGSYVPFEEDLLYELYRNHGTYVKKFNRSVRENLDSGYILKIDASEMRVGAAHADVP